VKFFDVEFPQCELTELDWSLLNASENALTVCDVKEELPFADAWALPAFPGCKLVEVSIFGGAPGLRKLFVICAGQVFRYHARLFAEGTLAKLVSPTLNMHTVNYHAAMVAYSAEPIGHGICAVAKPEEIEEAFGYEDAPLSVMQQNDGWRLKAYKTTRQRLAIKFEADIRPDGSVDFGSIVSEVSQVQLPGTAHILF
jgi:hypothetical protein